LESVTLLVPLICSGSLLEHLEVENHGKMADCGHLKTAITTTLMPALLGTTIIESVTLYVDSCE